MLVFAHRGASGYGPENTEAAFDLALSQGCDGVELDVQLTRDGVAVVHHDWTVDRTTDGNGEISNLTAAALAALDAGSWFAPAFAGQRVPTLAAVLRRIPERVIVNVELKARPQDRPGLEEAVLAVLETAGRDKNLIVSSFNHLCLRRLCRLAPQIPLGLLYEGVLLDPWDYAERQGISLYSLHPEQEYVAADFVAQAHRKGLKVACWTVNCPSRAAELDRMGVDAIITNYPDRCRPQRERV